MKFYQSYYTDIGTKRSSNQDSLAILKAETDFGDVLLAVLCDGMGGHALGELASKTCVTMFADWFKKELPAILYGTLPYERRIPPAWQRLVETANQRLADYGDETGIRLGSTVTAALFIREDLFLVHVGDSRCYEIGDSVVQLTRDHSVAAAVERGEIKLDPARKVPKRNVLTQSVGVTHGIHMDHIHKKLRKDGTYLICSDGFWHWAEETELIRYYQKQAVDSNKTLRTHLNVMVETVKSRGETDNISVLAVIPGEDVQSE